MKNIKQNLRLVAAAVFLSLMTIQSGAIAQTLGNSPLTFPADPAQNSTIDQRVAQRKTITKLQLNPTSAKDVSLKCPVAQTAIGAAKTKDSTGREVRLQAYINVANRLNQIIENLSIQGFDASDITAVQQKFNDTINRYLNDAQNYKTAMDDLVIIDCAKDPTGFAATLQQARTLRNQLSGDVTGIKNNFKDVEKSLNDVKKYLPKAKANS
jgi:hypothetical protein